MPRWPNNPETWKPRETTVTVPEVGEVGCVATFARTEDEGTGKTYHSRTGWTPNQRTHWVVVVTFGGKKIESPYSQGSAFTTPPSAEDVLGCLLLDASCADGTFEDYCGDMGLDRDSRSALDTYLTCQAEFELKLRRMFGAQFAAAEAWGQEQ